MGELLHDPRGGRLYLTGDERPAFLAAAAQAPRPVRTLCGVLAHTGCRVSEALQLTPRRVDLAGRALMFESLKKRRKGACRAVPVPDRFSESRQTARAKLLFPRPDSRPSGAGIRGIAG